MIRGFFNPASGLPVPWVRVLLSLPGLSQSWTPIDFLIDTGCTLTTLHPHDASYRMGIDESRLRLPSLLGWDILRHFELTTNLQEGRVTLRSLH